MEGFYGIDGGFRYVGMMLDFERSGENMGKASGNLAIRFPYDVHWTCLTTCRNKT